MSNAERQARWRKSTPLKRIELYLDPEIIEWLDELVQEHGASSRADVIENLILSVILPPLLVDVRRELLEAYQAVLQAATHRRIWATDIQAIMDKAMKRLEEGG